MVTFDQPNRDERSKHILDAAAELLASKPTASLSEIAAQAKIGKATLHRYFATREALMLELAYRALDLVSQAIAAAEPERDPAPQALQRLIEALIPLGDKLYFLLNEHIWDVEPELARADEQVQAPIVRLIARGQAEGSLRADVPQVWVVYQLNFSLFAAWQAIRDGDIARRDAPRLMLDSLLNGLRPQR